MKKSVTNIVVLYSIFGLVMTQAQEIEEITVTGSYIGSKFEKISVQVIDETEFNNLNVTSVGEISKYLSSSSGSHFQSNTLDGVESRAGHTTYD